MRVLAIGDECIRILRHFLGEIGVQIDDSAHRNPPIAEKTAQAMQNFAFHIVAGLRNHRSVQDEKNAVKLLEFTHYGALQRVPKHFNHLIRHGGAPAWRAD